MPPPLAVVALPTFLWGGVPGDFLVEAGLDGVEVDGRWHVRTREAVSGVRPPGLVTVLPVAGPGVHQDGFAELHQIELRSIVVPRDQANAGKLVARLIKRANDASGESTLPAVLDMLRSQLAVEPRDTAAERARRVFTTLAGMPIPGSTELRFPDAGLLVVARDPALVTRAMLPAVLVQCQQDPALVAGNTAHLVQAWRQGQRLFLAAEGLSQGVRVFDAYLAPLLGALSPWVWAFAVSRSAGSYVHTLGTAELGTTPGPAELLQTMPVRPASAGVPRPDLGTAGSSKAVTWWAERLDALFAIITDPAVFVDAAGEYEPARHLEAQLSIEQVFRRVGSILFAHRDRDARLVSMLTVLDTITDSLRTDRPFTYMCRPNLARKACDRLRRRFSTSPAAQILLPAADRAVAALDELASGFFIANQHGNNRIELHYDGKVENLDRDQATAEYIKLLRNATHGYGQGRQYAQAPRVAALLSQHDGHVPHDLPLLAYLYLLDLLTSLDQVRRSLQQGKK